MPYTALQSTLANISAGSSGSVNLTSHMTTPGTSFRVVQSNRLYPNSLLPAGFSLTSAGVLSWTAPSATGGPVLAMVRCSLGSRDPEASWTARTSGCYTKERFDDASGFNQFTPLSERDTTIKRSGTASMRQWIPANASVNTYAKFFYSTRIAQLQNGTTGNFSSNAGFGPGEEMFLQYSFRPGYNYVKWPWVSSAPKLTIIDRLPQTENNGNATANDWEVVHVLLNRQIWNGYYGTAASPGNSGPSWQITDPTDSNDLIYHPQFQNTSRVLNGSNPGMASGGTAGGAWTATQLKRGRNGYLWSYGNSSQDGKPDMLSDGVPVAIDEWTTFLTALKVASSPSANDGRIRVWLAHEGQDYKLVIDRAYQQKMNASAPYFTDQGGLSLNTIFSGVLFNNLAYQEVMTGKPLTEHWVDEIICSPSFIPAPDFDGTGNYRTADALLTIKVT